MSKTESHSTDFICPYCGAPDAENPLNYLVGSNVSGVALQCYECNKFFNAWEETIITYKTRQIPDDAEIDVDADDVFPNR